jgi:hypothetical protein
MSDGIPQHDNPLPIVETPDWAECEDCGGQVWIRIWGEGIDSETGCAECDNKEIYR